MTAIHRVCPGWVLAAVLALWLTPMPAAGQESAAEETSAALTIFVIDFQAALRRSSAAQSIQQQIDEARDRYQERFAVMEADLREAEATLSRERDALSEEEFATRRRDLEARVLEAQRAVQEGRATLDRALAEGMAQVRSALLEEVAQMADEEGVSIVLDQAQVILVSQSLDRTDQVIARLNARLPDIDLTGLDDFVDNR